MTHTAETFTVPTLRRRRENPWLVRALMFATVVLLVDALFGERGLRERLRATREYAATAAAVEDLKHRNAALRERGRRLREDPTTIELEARQELGLVKPGEILFVIREATSAREARSASAE